MFLKYYTFLKYICILWHRIDWRNHADRLRVPYGPDPWTQRLAAVSACPD